MIGDKLYDLSGWMKDTKDGGKWMSGTVKPNTRGGQNEDPGETW